MNSPILQHVVATEKASLLMDRENTLQFIVPLDATRRQVAKEIEREFQVKVEAVRIQITPKGQKRAIIRLAPENKAEEILSRLGVL
ncbi:MAG: 50S ribosomal protein L23 [Euryarchaeota archaeon]|nr:50S ribosomal protein L23 [Euryarchaeota archaeon]